MAFQGIALKDADDDAFTGAMLTAGHFDETRRIRIRVEEYLEAMAKEARKRKRGRFR